MENKYHDKQNKYQDKQSNEMWQAERYFMTKTSNAIMNASIDRIVVLIINLYTL